MEYKEMIAELEALNLSQGIKAEVIPHGRNLRFQLDKSDPDKLELFNRLFTSYLKTRTVPFDGDNVSSYVQKLSVALNEYLGLLWPTNPFAHQSDFASSIIPEALCTLFRAVIVANDVDLDVSAEVDLTIECTFSASGLGTAQYKNKRVDVAVIKPCTMQFNGVESVLPVPLLAIECKTNLDKNMLSGIEQSVTDLKKTFPACKYYVVSELSDFDVSLNYASSDIDEIYILRKQKRGSIRSGHCTRNSVQAELLMELVRSLDDAIRRMQTPMPSLNKRMLVGKLIGRRG